MSYLSHPIASLCMSVPNTTNSSREMSLWNICLANWSKGYSLKSPNAIIALSTAELGSFSCCEASWKWLRVIWVQTHLQWKLYSSGSVAQADEFGRWNIVGKELDFNAALWLLLWEAKYGDNMGGFCWPYMWSYYPTHWHQSLCMNEGCPGSICSSSLLGLYCCIKQRPQTSLSTPYPLPSNMF